MAEPLSIDNSNVSIERTYLTDDVVATNDTLPIANDDGIVANMFACLAGFGYETAELVAISAVATGSLSITELLRDHAKLTPVLILQADKYRVYRAINVDGSTPADGSFSQIAEIDVAVDKVQTPYVDPAGGQGYWYKVTQFNSLTGDETALADSTAVRGAGFGDYAPLNEIRDEAGLGEAERISDSEISRYRRRAQAEIDSRLGQYFTVPFSPVPQAIHDITVLLATGWLLRKQYGLFDDGATKDGKDRLKEARDWLTAILTSAQGGTSALPGAELLPGQDDGVSGWPDDTTATADPHHGAGGDFMFRIGERF